MDPNQNYKLWNLSLNCPDQKQYDEKAALGIREDRCEFEYKTPKIKLSDNVSVYGTANTGGQFGIGFKFN